MSEKPAVPEAQATSEQLRAEVKSLQTSVTALANLIAVAAKAPLQTVKDIFSDK